MRITRELRLAISELYPERPRYRAYDPLVEAAEKLTEVRALKRELDRLAKLQAAADKKLLAMGLYYSGGRIGASCNHYDRLRKLVKVEPLPHFVDIVRKVAQLPATDAVAYLKTLGIDWSNSNCSRKEAA